MKSRDFTLDSLLHYVFIIAKHRENSFFTAEEIDFSEEMAWGCGPHQYAKEQGMKCQEKGSFCGGAVSM